MRPLYRFVAVAATLLFVVVQVAFPSGTPPTASVPAPPSTNLEASDVGPTESSEHPQNPHAIVRPSERALTLSERRHDATSSPPTARPCPDSAFLQRYPPKTERTFRFLTLDAVSPSFGLTNQLISYAQAIFLASRTHRAIVVPENTTPNFESLLSITATERCLGCGLAIRLPSQTNVQPMKSGDGPYSGRVKFPRFHLPGRKFVAENPIAARQQIDSQLRRLNASRGLRLSTVMWHVPFVPSDAPMLEGYFLNCLHFHPAIEERSQYTVATLQKRGGERGQFAALHLRLEPDVQILSINPPSAQQVVKLFRRCLLASSAASRSLLLPNGNFPVYMLNGHALDKGILKAIASVWEPQLGPVMLPNRPEMASFNHSLPGFSASSLKSGVPVTNHYLAAVDLGIVAKANLVVSADFSSFAKAAHLRFCEEQKANEGRGKSAFFTYNRHFSSMTLRTCDEVQRWASIPYAYLPIKDREPDCRI